MDKLTLAILTISAKVVLNKTNLDDELINYVCPLTGEKLTTPEIEKISDEIKIKITIESAYKYSEVEDPALIVDPEGHEEWYFDWLKENSHNMYHWNQLKTFLEKQLIKKMKPEKAGEVIKSIDNASEKVLARLQSPKRVAFDTKGLVLGYVQSGKTANFTAVIAKAVDAGYKMIVVLSGIHDNLRSQTQNRLDKELTGLPATKTDHVPIPTRPDKIWARMTGEGDFKDVDTLTLQELALSTRPVLVVMKKKPQILKKLIKWVKKCPEEVRRNIPLLIIDDEADQASINIGTSTKPTPTNGDIRTTLQFFRKNAYVGYTATPFANVLIDMGVDGEWGRDLYPRNFIVSLPRPDNYIGADQIFNNGYDKYFVKTVPDNEATLLKGKTKGKKNNPQITEDLKKSVFSFILSAATRYARGDSDKPMTMLIHTTHYTIEHSVLKKLILNLIKEIKSTWLSTETRKELKDQFEILWKDDFSKATKELPYGYKVIPFEHIEKFIAPFLVKLEIFTLNSRSEDKLDYT
ncbi:hypothetical protein HQN89_31450 [Paenibacillus frigoriresistens]|uniref:Z1 domain-containing protein n=1 Tax=Paenibacillus alginolyticus TaxID=59839 RepID=UPI00156358E8|nr:Z1 domain-containing protein [Paenibacillus frigoriresistens]NRF95393.1 hypothetical protein [Paenibacillus frigoriresistens]